MKFVIKEPDKGYVSNSLWIPKSGIRTDPIKRSLEFLVPGGDGQFRLRMWEESKNHLICPREFFPKSHYGTFKFPVVDIKPQFEYVDFEDRIIPRDAEQQRAWEALKANDNGILNLACGKGKTILAIKKIAQMKGPALVIVPNGGILSQWREAIQGSNNKQSGLGIPGDVGLIQGDFFQWDCPVVLALVSSLWPRIEDGRIPTEMYRKFKTIIFDECHQIGAPKFSITAKPFYGNRIGLTATLHREDGLDPIYRYHIGEPFYSDLTQDLVPLIYFQQTPVVINHLESVSTTGMVNISMLRGALGRDYMANVARFYQIKKAVDSGRKVLCLSHSVNQLRLFHAMFPGSSLIIGDTDKDARMDLLRNSNVCFATASLGATGVDDDRLDTLFWLTPFRSKISLQQSMGRIQRRREGKKQPIMVVFEEWLTTPLKKLTMRLKSNLREWGYEFQTLKPSEIHNRLPEHEQQLYDREVLDISDVVESGD